MKLDRRGISLTELIFALGVMLIVLCVGYRSYFGLTRADDIEKQRESITLTVQNAMSRIKEDVRAASAVSVTGSSLTAFGSGFHVTYHSLPGGGLDRVIGTGHFIYKNVNAAFTRSGSGVDVALSAKTTAHGRAIRVDLQTFISPRNR